MAPAGRGDETDSSRSERLRHLIAARAPQEGCLPSLHPRVWFHRRNRPIAFSKEMAFGPRISIVAQGRKVVRFGGEELRYDEDTYLVVTGEVGFEGQVVEASPARPYLCVTVEIPPEVVVKTLLALRDVAPPRRERSRQGPTRDDERDGDPAAPAAFVSSLDASLEDTVSRLIRAVDDPVEREIVAPLIIEELVFRLFRSDAARVLRLTVGPAGDVEKIRKAMRYMKSRLAEPLSVEAVARHVAMSPSHFAHRFRSVAGLTPMRYLKQVRLLEARDLMLSQGIRVGEAAARVSYESASHFARDFKRTYGMSPAAYVRQSAQATVAARTRSQD